MPDDMDIDTDKGIIRIHSHGDVQRTDILRSIALMEIARLRTGIDRVLVDTRDQQSLPSTHTLFTIFANFPENLTVALIADTRQATARDLRFLETVAQNRARAIRLFSTESAALAWLAAGDPAMGQTGVC